MRPLLRFEVGPSKIAEVDMFKLYICVAIVIFMSLAGCGVSYNWVPKGSVECWPNTEYEGTGVSDPNPLCQ